MRSRATVMALSAAAVTAAAACWSWWFPAYDDAFITLTSAQALWTGRIPNFPEASPLHGVTSPIHCGLVALLLPLAPTPLAALWWSLLIGAAFYIAGLWRLSAPLVGWQRWAVVATGLLAGAVWNHLTSGLETGLAMAAATWIAVGAREEARWLPVLLGVAPWIRPEFGLISSVLAAYYAWSLRREAWLPLLVMAVVAAPLALWLYLNIGTVFPSSLGVKLWMESTRLPTPFERGIMLYLAIWLFLLACGPAALGFGGLHRQRGGLPLTFAVVAIVAGYAVTQPGLLVMYQAQRYAYPALPFALAGLVALAVQVSPRQRATLIGAAIAYAVALFPHNATLPLEWRAHFADEYRTESALLKSLPEGTVVAVGDAGVPAYVSTLPLVDIVGLKTPSAAQVHREITAPSGGHDLGRALDVILRSHHAKALVLWYGWDQTVGFTQRLKALGWHVSDFRPLIRNRLGQYRYVMLVPPTAS